MAYPLYIYIKRKNQGFEISSYIYIYIEIYARLFLLNENSFAVAMRFIDGIFAMFNIVQLWLLAERAKYIHVRETKGIKTVGVGVEQRFVTQGTCIYVAFQLENCRTINVSRLNNHLCTQGCTIYYQYIERIQMDPEKISSLTISCIENYTINFHFTVKNIKIQKIRYKL